MKHSHSLILALYISISMISCESEQTSIVFTKKTEESEMTITLKNDSTFVHNAKHIHGVTFNEVGRYSIHDSIIVLDYTNPEYSYNCYTIPLPNDTLLFGTYDDKILLHTLYKTIPGEDTLLNHAQVMERIVNQYNNPHFSKYIGTLIFVCTQGKPENLYKHRHAISMYYDKFLNGKK